MKPRTNGVPRAQRSKSFEGEGPNWVLIAGSALLSTLSIHLGYKLKQAFDAKQAINTSDSLKGNGESTDRKNSEGFRLHSDGYFFSQDDGSCLNYISGAQRVAEMKQQPSGQLITQSDMALPLMTVPALEFNKENNVLWASSPDHLGQPQKPFHHSNHSDSPCISESGSEIFSKREVIQKLRQQLKRRDDMILEMQDQIAELQNTLSSQSSHYNHLQSMLDARNLDLFHSKREVQRLRKAIADHCVGQVRSNTKPSTVSGWPLEGRNGYANGYLEVDSSLELLEKGRGDGDRIEMLRKEVWELKEVIEGKEYLLQNYKDQKTELSMKIKELQLRLDSQLPNIL